MILARRAIPVRLNWVFLQHFSNYRSDRHNSTDANAQTGCKRWRNAVQNLYDAGGLGDGFDARIQELLGVGFELLDILVDSFG